MDFVDHAAPLQSRQWNCSWTTWDRRTRIRILKGTTRHASTARIIQLYHHRGPVVIESKELEDYGLVAPNLAPHQRDLALERLSKRIRQGERKIVSSDLPLETGPGGMKIPASG